MTLSSEHIDSDLSQRLGECFGQPSSRYIVCLEEAVMILLKYVESKCGSVDDIVHELQIVTKEQVDQYT